MRKLIVAGMLVAAACSSGAKQAACPAPELAPSPPTSKPAVEIPSGPAPIELVKTDLVVGTGAVATTGCEIQVQYVGVRFDDGSEFDSSWENGDPYSLELGQGTVIAGWDLGIPGMKVGGRRQLIIPSDLGGGADGEGPIPGGVALVYVIDLIATEETSTA
jgi:FKBP-type peptidyl-prolyl cis-trans isomerase